MPARSRAQQRFFGAVVRCKRTGQCISPKVKAAAKSVSMKEAREFAGSVKKRR